MRKEWSKIFEIEYEDEFDHFEHNTVASYAVSILEFDHFEHNTVASYAVSILKNVKSGNPNDSGSET